MCLAQKINQTSVMRDINSQNYFRIIYENDFFAQTDYNYTQGYSIEWVSPKLAKNPLNYLFVKFANENNKYGLTIEGIGFTPKDLVSFDIQFGDRPFSSATVIKSFVIATDKIKNHRLSTALSIGMIGPVTLGRQTQVAIHKLTDSAIPNGWQHQIRNDFIINYQLDFEKPLLNLKYVVLNGDAKIKLGTLFTNASVGSNLIVGKFQLPYNEQSDKSFQFYGFVQPLLNFVGYDSNLQGGLLNMNSAYTIDHEDINLITFQLNYGLVMKYKKYYLELAQSYLSEEFVGGGDARWGSVRFAFEY